MKIIKQTTKYHNLAIIFPYDEDAIQTCRTLKESLGWQSFSFHVETKTWVFSLENFEKVCEAFPNVEPTIEVVEDWKRWKSTQTEIEKTEKLAAEPVTVEGLPLFPYQELGVGFASAKPRVLIADEMGLGKSIQSLGVVKHLELDSTLVVCPASLKGNWQKEIEKWLGFETLEANRKNIYLSRPTGPEQSITIVNYENLDFYAQAKKVWDLVIFDEFHYCKNGKTKRTKAAKEVAKIAKRVIGLTGTPVLNRPAELVSQLDILGHIKSLGGGWRFQQRFCDAKQDSYGHWNFSGASNLDSLKREIAPFTLRRTKTEVLTDLPDKLVHPTYLDMLDVSAYEAVRAGIATDLDLGANGYQSFYKELAGLNDIQKAEYLDGMKQNKEYRKLAANTLTLIERLKQEAARQKLEMLPEILEEFRENKRKVVVFCTHKTLVDQLVLEYPKESVGMHGDVDPTDRQKMVEKFQEDPDCLFFFGTIKTAGVGFTLTAASDVIFLELDWTPTLHQQAEDRCYRIGQKNNVNVNYLILKDSIDEDIVELLMQKSGVIEGAIKGNVLAKILKKNLQLTDLI